MADEPQALRAINWRDVFPFTHIFRAFRIAIHPSKLVLALLALLALYLGGRVLDALWAPRYQAVPGEVQLYEQSPTDEAFVEARDQSRRPEVERYAAMLQRVAAAKTTPEWEALRDDQKAVEAAERGEKTADVSYWIRTERDRAIQPEREAYLSIREKGDADAIARARKAFEDRTRQAYYEAEQRLRVVKAVHGVGLFEAFLEYQSQQIRNVAYGVLGGNWLGGLTGPSIGGAAAPGVVVSTFRFFTTAPAWALRYHWLYFILWGALFLVVWSLFGGAIARIAAVHAADEERKLSMRQGLSFAVSKFLSFLSAPIIPLIIVGGIGLIVAAVGAVGFLLYLDVLIGIFYFLALAAGFVMTLVLLGTAGGFNLMYPTIAVEGSDSFDAISRSFSYVYSKPWRMLFYSAVAIAYGALCYLFVRLFIWLMLLLTHFFVGLFVYRHADDTSYLWYSIQPPPSFLSLPYHPNWDGMSTYGDLTSFFVAFWSYLAIAALGAFAISFYFSVNTIIYYLVRRDADATEMDDVYLERAEEDFGETTPATPAPGTTTATTAPASETAAAPADTTATSGAPGGVNNPAPGESPPPEQPTPPPGEAPPSQT